MKNRTIRITTTLLSFLILVILLPPVVTADVTVENVASLGGWPECAVFNGNTAYFAQGRRLVMFDVTDGQLINLGAVMLEEEPESMILQDNFIYALSNSNLRIIDISSPLAPINRGSIAHTNAWNGRLAISGNHVYAVINDGVMIIDVSDVDAPQVVSTFEPDAREVAVMGQTLLVGKEKD